MVQVLSPSCEELDPEANQVHFHEDHPTHFEFVPTETGIHYVLVRQAGLELVVEVAGNPAVPQDSHCSPFCAQGYHLRAT